MTSPPCQSFSLAGHRKGEDDTRGVLFYNSHEFIQENKPRYLMGVGTPVNILEGIALGIDMFDCVMPTRNARNGMLFTAYGSINIKNIGLKILNKVFNNYHSWEKFGFVFFKEDINKKMFMKVRKSQQLKNSNKIGISRLLPQSTASQQLRRPQALQAHA